LVSGVNPGVVGLTYFANNVSCRAQKGYRSDSNRLENYALYLDLNIRISF
jgi:hypothetical protein